MCYAQELGKDTGSGKPDGFAGRVGRVRVAGQQFSRPEPAGTRSNIGTQYKVAVKQ
jgi:hypothetical protein